MNIKPWGLMFDKFCLFLLGLELSDCLSLFAFLGAMFGIWGFFKVLLLRFWLMYLVREMIWGRFCEVVLVFGWEYGLKVWALCGIVMEFVGFLVWENRGWIWRAMMIFDNEWKKVKKIDLWVCGVVHMIGIGQNLRWWGPWERRRDFSNFFLSADTSRVPWHRLAMSTSVFTMGAHFLGLFTFFCLVWLAIWSFLKNIFPWDLFHESPFYLTLQNNKTKVKL